MTKVVVIGGGFTGAAAAIHLVRQSKVPLDIHVIEPRADVGRGVAFSATDPDHRLNSLANLHVVYPETPHHFEDWLRHTGRFEWDPEMQTDDGNLIARRSDFGAYMNEQFLKHVAQNASASVIRHVRGQARRIDAHEDGFVVDVDGCESLPADLLILATNNEQPAIPPAFVKLASDGHSRFVANPWELAQLDQVEEESEILIIGAGLTAADVAATVVRDKPLATIDAISRSGIRPTSRVRSSKSKPLPLWDRLGQEPSLFEQKHGRLTSVLEMFMAFRREVRGLEAEGRHWQIAFDDVRDSARSLWMQLSLAEKARFQRHLRRQYDSSRFRYAPQIEEIVGAAELEGKLVFRRASIVRAEPADQGIRVVWHDEGTGQDCSKVYQVVVNCTGPAKRPDRTDNPVLQMMLQDGLARIAPLGIGIDVDEHCRVISAGGAAHDQFYAFGSLTFATFGYALAGPFIVDQVIRAMPGMLQD